MKTLEDACQSAGVNLGTPLSEPREANASVRYHPMPNWYGCFKGLTCPRCENKILWEWEGELPGITTPKTISQAGVAPVVTHGGTLLAWGHRWIEIKCDTCQQAWVVHNFD